MRKYAQCVALKPFFLITDTEKDFFIDSGQRFKKVKHQKMNGADGRKDESPEKTREDVFQSAAVMLCCAGRTGNGYRLKDWSRISNKVGRDSPGSAHGEEEEIGERCGKEGFISIKGSNLLSQM